MNTLGLGLDHLGSEATEGLGGQGRVLGQANLAVVLACGDPRAERFGMAAVLTQGCHRCGGAQREQRLEREAEVTVDVFQSSERRGSNLSGKG